MKNPVVKTKIKAMAATRDKGMASMRVAIKRANGVCYACVCSKEVVST